MDIDVFNCWDRSRFKDETLMPPGFRFHPTDEELITHYLLKKVLDTNFTCEAISQVNLNKSEPWDLPEKAKKMGDKEWFFFTQRDRKYPTGLRTNRATEAGYWKATGKDREIKSTKTNSLLGMKKTLVFYKGRAPKGVKSRWVMHEYRLDGKFSYNYITSSAKDEWVLCKVCLKSAAVSVVAGEVSSSALSSGSVTAPTSEEHVSCFSNASVSAYTKAASFSTYLPSPPPLRQSGRFDDDVAFGQFMEPRSYGQFSFDAALLPNLPPTVFPPPPPQSFSTYGGSALGYWPFAI